MASRRERREDGEGGFGWSRFFSALGVACSLLLLVAVLVGLVWGTRPLERIASRQNELHAHVVAPTIDWPVVKGADGAARTWLTQQEREGLLRLASDAMAGGDERFSGEPLQRVWTAMRSSGWFVGSPIVRREHKGMVHVSGMWRVPAAYVTQAGAGEGTLVSWEGLPMPARAGQERSGMIDPSAKRQGYPVVRNTRLGMPRHKDGSVDYHTAWSGEDVAASLELLAVVLGQPWSAQVAGIEASAFSSEGSLTILTTYGTRVVWGGRASKPALGEVSTDAKLAHLASLYRSKQRIDAGYPLIYVNSSKLQIDVSATAQALAQERAQAQAAREQADQRQAAGEELPPSLRQNTRP